MCSALGLISEDECHDLTLIRKIRNEFAHNMQASFDDQAIKSRCKALRYRIPDEIRALHVEPIPTDPLSQFTSAAVNIILHLENRPHYVSLRRCAYQTWPY